MASHAVMLGPSSTCLACLRKLANPRTGVALSGGLSVINQIRSKSRFKRPQDQGVVVRLLEDIPKFGRKDAIFKVARGRMRNEWYPNNKAEYMTKTRFQELGLSRQDVGERDPSFGESHIPELPVEPEIPALNPSPEFDEIELRPLNADQTRELLDTLPESLQFARKPVTPSISPLIQASSGDPSGAIFGSVTTLDVANEIKRLLGSELDASPLLLGPDDIRFVDLEEGSDRIKALGRWAVDIAVQDQQGDVRPIRRSVEVLPSE
ncbi:hypothetical protein QBC47DRAFT_376380 [Echria macrotheca]|uniref:Ribosomal protein L9 domain-containing protein n=1 Tax=Echria macrotheca TaxID=438768 RepID=A0AAJ0BKI1_9PEZI|nr:hypothetical protein QBC47DRAFT_376380 [Echria macrotheca]